MNSDFILNFMVFWAVWILIPVLMDGTIAFNHILFSWRTLWRRRNQIPQDTKLDYYPQVTIVIPVHNSAGTLYRCLESLAQQNYDVSRMEVVIIENGSTDNSFDVFNEFTSQFPQMSMRWVKIHEAGKAKALNSGVFLGTGQILINIDSDTILDPNVIVEAVRALTSDQEIAGATGAIMVDHRQISQDSLFLNIIQTCELFEYLEAFFIGRKYQAHNNTLFTLAGAFSCFNKQFLLRTFLYDSNSIAEDTKLTFELRRTNSSKRLAFLEKIKVYVEPIPGLAKLYSQRVRWQRGELDVISSYLELYRGNFLKLLNSFAARLLFIDHTMIFPRVVWTVLTPFLVFLGYPLQLIIFANLFVFLMYFIIDINYLIIAFFYVDEDYRKYILANWWKIILLPIYRFIVFWFRAAGAIHSVTEGALWNVKNPVDQSREALMNIKQSTVRWVKHKMQRAPGSNKTSPGD
jgi:putative glycosyltransferase (exosortase G-associated)